MKKRSIVGKDFIALSNRSLVFSEVAAGRTSPAALGATRILLFRSAFYFIPGVGLVIVFRP